MSDTWLPYVVRSGDYLIKIATRFGIDAGRLWSDPRNEELRTLRGNPNVLYPGDVLYVPKREARWHKVTTGAVNRLTANVPSVEIHVTFVSEGKAVASEPCRIRELPALKGLRTDPNGTLRFSAPLVLEVATVEFTNLSLTQTLLIGVLDPVREQAGVQQRLRNLGFFTSGPPQASQKELVAAAIDAFRRSIGESGEGELDDKGREQLEKTYGC